MPHSTAPQNHSVSEGEASSMADTPNASGDGHSQQSASSNDVAMTGTNGTNGDEKKDVKLDDLFADVDSDDEFPSSRPDGGAKPSSAPIAPSSPIRNDNAHGMSSSDPELLRMFYQRLFPFRYLFQWLNHSPTPTNDFGHREFALNLISPIGDDIYSRYNSYPTADLIRKDIVSKLPTRFEIGPVYTTNPRDRKSLRNQNSFKPLAKELCFDIDLTDYDGIRTCCNNANICNKCWQFMTMAVKTIDTALREDFGFKHIMWVYSGRRGVHAWVSDKKARAMDDQKRRAIAGYLEVIKGGAQSGKKVNLWRPLHPHLSRSLDILAPHFQTDILETQDPWADSARAEHLLSLLPDKALNDSLRKKWDSSPGRSSTLKWADIDALAKSGASKSLRAQTLLEAKQDVVLEYTYPRLDIEVTKKLNHLLKSPFVVHPGTGRVCVPIDPRKLDDFDPLAVPTVQELLAEIDSWTGDADGKEGKSPADWEKTSLRPYVEFFRTYVLNLMRDEKDSKVKREREEGDAMEF
ncbi:DNA primase small subunit [Astrocystis sublimbata]|nr:DNA primase small subunit [Astrocystis sublimbata]